MSHARYTLNKVLTEDQLEAIIADGLRLLKDIGIECSHPGIQALVAKVAGAGVRNGRLWFSEGLCGDHIEKIRSRARGLRDPSLQHTQKSKAQESTPADARIKLTPVGPWTCIQVIDMDTQQYRPGTLKDLVDATKLAEALGITGRKICAPIAPHDVPGHLNCLAMAKESWKYSATTGAGVASTVREIEFLWEMGQLARVTPPYCFLEYAISPLTFNADALDLAFKLRGTELIQALAIDPGPIPTLGGTGPLSFKAVLAQSVAETLGGSILADLLTGGDTLPLCSAMTAVATDMRFGTVNFSSPESIMLLQMGFEVGSYVTGSFGMGGAMRTIGKRPDAQAAAEKTMCTLIGALSGARHFCDLGQISVDEVFSFEQMVIDTEILASVERFVNGFPFEVDLDSVAAVREGLETRNFYGSPLTLDHFKDYYWFPQMFEYRMLATWQAEGAKTIEEKARATAREKIASVHPRVDDATARQMDALFQKAAGKLS
jgi:trimethylamine--corrinoid protein Co-methyltransferase